MRIAGLLLAFMALSVAAQAQQTLTLEIKDFATVPITGLPIGNLKNEMLLARSQRDPAKNQAGRHGCLSRI